MLDKGIGSSKNYTYTSCIKIDGEPILPPLITDDVRTKLLSYRDRAVAVEQRLKQQKSIATGRSATATGIDNVDHQFKFRSCSIPPGTASFSFGFDQQQSPLISADSGYCTQGTQSVSPPNISSARTATPSLSSCLLDVAEFSDDGCRVVYHSGSVAYSDPDSDSVTISHSDNTVKEPPPRLVRSGSYILDTPSPVLLAHLQKQSQSVVKNLEMESGNSATVVASSATAAVARLSNSSMSEQTSYDEEVFLDPVHFRSFDSNESKPQFVETSVVTKNHPQNTDSTNTDVPCRFKDSTLNDDSLMDLLKAEDRDGPKASDKETCSSNILFGLSAEECFSSLRSCLQSKDIKIIETVPSIDTKLELEEKPADVQLQFMGITNDSVAPAANMVHSVRERTYIDSTTVAYCKVIETIAGDDEMTYLNEAELIKHGAASVIQAGVRGYLVRRLMKTEKVQSLIQTIRDAVLCAVQLHEVDELEEADVELHRRLIQQVSAACYAFHDVFFALTVSEQMAIITADRKRKAEKAKRSIIHSQ